MHSKTSVEIIFFKGPLDLLGAFWWQISHSLMRKIILSRVITSQARLVALAVGYWSACPRELCFWMIVSQICGSRITSRGQSMSNAWLFFLLDHREKELLHLLIICWCSMIEIRSLLVSQWASSPPAVTAFFSPEVRSPVSCVWKRLAPIFFGVQTAGNRKLSPADGCR